MYSGLLSESGSAGSGRDSWVAMTLWAIAGVAVTIIGAWIGASVSGIGVGANDGNNGVINQSGETVTGNS